MGKTSLNLAYLAVALAFVVGAWFWKIWPLAVLAAAAFGVVFIKRRTR